MSPATDRPPPAWTWDDEIATELRLRFRQWTRCNSSGLVDQLEQYLHPAFLYVSVFGRRYDRDGYLTLVRSLEPGATYIVHRAAARVNGPIAQLDGDYFTHSVTNDGEDLSAHTRFTATWVHGSDGWRCLTQQGTSYEPDERTRDEVAALLRDQQGR